MAKKTFIYILILSVASIPLGFAQGYTIEANGAKLHYKIFGKGEPLLIINGGPGMNSNGFAEMAKNLAENYQTIIYDQRGTGQSILSNRDHTAVTMDWMVKDMEALRKYLKLEEWTLLGHSFGGMLAYYYATKHPERVKAMIQSSSGGMDLALLSLINLRDKLSEMEWDSLQHYQSQLNEGDTSYATQLKRGEFMAPAYLYNRKHIPVLAERLTQGDSQLNGWVWADLRKINFDTKETLSSFEKPVLIIHGRNDLLDEAVAETAHQILPNSQLELLDRCAHYGWLDRPDVYYKLIDTFMSHIN
ncbi:alpha/beta fold hydrolase [Marivirga sp. S37H4]|uniref:Alpha/beta fold hydrolase n=2 Tax=Marivirga aurantiaca TaxID=2802615 RepID=A0A935CB83_9BACT|nr:alpha/beta fold hydrolase [Marivirga aurantiaca]